MRLQSKRSEFKAKIASNNSAIAKIFNAVIVSFECSIANHDLFSGSLGACRTWAIRSEQEQAALSRRAIDR